MEEYQIFEDNFLVNIVYVEKYKYAEDWESYIHTHPFTEVFYVLDGKGYSVMNDKSERIKKDDIFIINPNTPHTEYSDEVEKLEYICFAVRGLSYQNEESRVIRSSSLKDTKIYFELLHQEFHKDKPNHDLVCSKLAEIILSNISHFSKLDLYVYDSVFDESTKARAIKDYLEKNVKEDITLDLLADKFKMNKFYLVHMFKNTYGVSPITFIINAKLKIAKDLLVNSDYTIQNISDTLNYSSQSYFSQIFKKNTGLSPADFRKVAKKEVQNVQISNK